MKRIKLSRRTVLRGLVGGAAVAIGLPALEIFLNANGTAYAGTGTLIMTGAICPARNVSLSTTSSSPSRR